MKILFAAILTGVLLSATPMQPAAAAPLEISGTASLKYEADSADSRPTEGGTMYSLTLRGEQKLSPLFSLFARLGAQYASNPVLADFSPSAYGPAQKGVLALDQFGLIYKPAKLTFTLGRQEATIGATRLLYSRSETNIGKDAFVDGLTVRGTIGAVDISAVAAKENNIWQARNNSLYALRGGYSLSKKFSIGATLARYHYYDAGSTNHWAVDATATFGKSSLTAEYARSDRREANKACAVTYNYDFNGKTALYVTYFRVEANGDMGGQSDFDPNNRGFQYGLTHSFSDSLSLEAVYKAQVLLADQSKNSRWELLLKNTF